MEKRYEHSACDQQAREIWKQNKTYTTDQAATKQYTIDTPPPTVSGSLHIGHIFSYTQADIIARFKRMTGHSVFYPFGFDCNGLATERFVEKKHKTNVSKLGREKFIQLCLDTTEEMKKEFVELWEKIGISANFTTTYSTISKEVQKISQESFIDLYQKNFLYLKHEPALYCTICRTSVAQAELDDKEVPSTFNDIAFKGPDGSQLIIATTRPELLPSCVALLYHPDDSRYQALADQKAIVPIFNHEVPILADDSVDPEKGTGLVMVCTFGDKTDIEWYKKFNLPYKQSIGFDGKWVEAAGPLAGLKVHEARAKILELLKEQGLLLAQKAISHNVNVHERCKNEIEYVVLKQWFVKVVENKKKFLELADQIAWYPKHMKSRYIDWVENLSWDWCISRQRVFGIPFPVWYCNDCDAVLIADKAQLPIDPQKQGYDKQACDQCDSNNIRPEKDVMDTWNTSSLTPYICKTLYKQDGNNPFADNDFLPMTMRPQAHDIIRTWAFYTIIKAWMHQQKLPWRNIVISGFVLSEQKEKISKSRGNAPTEPKLLLQQFAPDAIRYWTASGTLGQDIAFSPEQIKIGQKLMTKLWNAFKFAHMHLENYTHTNEQPSNLTVVNQWILDASSQALEKYCNYLENNEFGLALQVVEKLFWTDFCDNYLEIIKDQFFNPDAYSNEERQATLWTLYTVGLRILQCYGPYLPHITENIYQTVYQKTEQVSSLHSTQFPTTFSTVDENNTLHMKKLLELISTVRKLKTEKQLSLRTELKSLTIQCSDKLAAILKKQEATIKGVCKAKTIQFETIEQTEITSNDDETWSASVIISEK